ncbi:TPA: hypothetical protein ACSVZR_002334 [Bacillus cereus]
MYKAGATKKEITDYTNSSETNLYKYLKIRGIETRKPSLDTLKNRLDKASQMYLQGEVIHNILSKARIGKKLLYDTIDELEIPRRRNRGKGNS